VWLQRMTASLAAADDASEISVAATESDPPGDLAGARRTVWLLEDGGLRRLAAVPEAHVSVGADDDPPPWAKEALESAAQVYAAEKAAARARWPELGDQAPSAVAVLPLALEDRVFGVFELELDQGGEVSADDRALLAAVAEQISQALDRARLHALESRSHERQALLADAAVLSAGALDPVEILRRLTLVAVPRLGDWCAALMSLGQARAGGGDAGRAGAGRRRGGRRRRPGGARGRPAPLAGVDHRPHRPGPVAAVPRA
jgi:GAF domain-containing protein